MSTAFFHFASAPSMLASSIFHPGGMKTPKMILLISAHHSGELSVSLRPGRSVRWVTLVTASLCCGHGVLGGRDPRSNRGEQTRRRVSGVSRPAVDVGR